MSNIAIKVENLSKQYRLGEVGTGTISHDLNRWWHRIRGKEDPYLKIGEINDRSKKGQSEYVWALKDINFEVQQGEVLGIIGKNGAGKSTLLKILSKVTGPTTGSIKAKGRIASLLEVGTGFHPELTGRENIYLNGTILGMTRAEVSRKLDEIVDFAGVERYLDTPVKRYSSGMMVRLGFAVAAHLEPEILIVDEVLAVGDADFQKKAIGKIEEVSQRQGRTVLFVSHNMGSVQNLCTRGILLHNGRTKQSGSISNIINAYLNDSKLSSKVNLAERFSSELASQKEAYFSIIELFNVHNKSSSAFFFSEEIYVHLTIQANIPIENPQIGVRLSDAFGNWIAAWRSEELIKENLSTIHQVGKIKLKLTGLNILEGIYSLSVSLKSSSRILDYKEAAIQFEIIPAPSSESGQIIHRGKNGKKMIIHTPAQWQFDFQ